MHVIELGKTELQRKNGQKQRFVPGSTPFFVNISIVTQPELV